MRRADRLLQIVQVLRRRKAPTTAQMLAQELEVTTRTIYRDIVTLQSLRVPIEGATGIGYLLRSGYDLPPLMFSSDEIEAIVLGMGMVSARSDPALTKSAQNALAKIEAVIPIDAADQIWRAALMVPHSTQSEIPPVAHLATIRLAVTQNRKLIISYKAVDENASTRTIWPLGLYLYSHVTLVCAWCELRGAYRAFRADRITDSTLLDERFNPKNGAMMREFLASFSG